MKLISPTLLCVLILASCNTEKKEADNSIQQFYGDIGGLGTALFENDDDEEQEDDGDDEDEG